jgi:hypothetical protein
MNDLPPDFDWVSARKKCSALEVFEQLRQDAKSNVEAFKAGAERSACDFITTQPDVFSVFRQEFRGLVGVRFVLRNSEIQIEGEGGIPVNMTATLTLNDKGECRLRVGNDELDRWQVLRRALEPVLFRPER